MVEREIEEERMMSRSVEHEPTWAYRLQPE
jgi:hypothetical protein